MSSSCSCPTGDATCSAPILLEGTVRGTHGRSCLGAERGGWQDVDGGERGQRERETEETWASDRKMAKAGR